MAASGRRWPDRREVRELFRQREVDMAGKFEKRNNQARARNLLWKQLAARLARQGEFQERTGRECTLKYHASLRYEWAKRLRKELRAEAAAQPPPPDSPLAAGEASAGSAPAEMEKEEAEVGSGSGKKPAVVIAFDLNVPLEDDQ